MMETRENKGFNPKAQKNRRTKVNLVFDPVARKEFLSGFHKRKLQRKKNAQDQLKQRLKEEKKNLRKEARETYKKLVSSRQGVPEVEHLLSEEYELENHSVSITELSATDLAEKNNWIGNNKVQYEDVKKEEGSKNEEEELPGMELKTKKQIKNFIKKQATKSVQNSKAFQAKVKFETQKNKKKARRQKKQDDKIIKNSKKGKKLRVLVRR